MSAVSVLGWTRPRHQGAASIGGRSELSNNWMQLTLRQAKPGKGGRG